MDKEINLNTVTSTIIDNILDEIDENEKKYNTQQLHSDNNNEENVNWEGIIENIRNNNANYIKTLIASNDININSQNPISGKTLLIYSTIIGNLELVRIICNFGADVHIKDENNLDALDYAIQYGRYNITQLIFYQQLSGSLGKDLKDIATQIFNKNKQLQFMKEFEICTTVEKGTRYYTPLSFCIVSYMIEAIKKRLPFSQDLLHFAWYFVINSKTIQEGHYLDEFSKCADPLLSELWTTLMSVCGQIICDTSDKQGWKWLKMFVLNSLIWYLPHPKYSNNSNISNDTFDDSIDDNNDTETILKTMLFYELLCRVRAESKKQSNILLKEKIEQIKSETPDKWDQLIKYNISNTKHSKNARQDSVGCLISKYSENDLSAEIYPNSTHFSAKKHYNKNIYLNNLLFNGNILDREFQRDVKIISKQIGLANNISIHFRAGPIKTKFRCQAKVENDYINESFPTAAKILDINRCSIQFKSIDSMMKFIQIFTNKIKTNKGRSLIDIIRCKNGWSVYNSDYPQYTDIKLNVLVQSSMDKSKKIIAEIQLLLFVMSKFKKVSHKLYSIERKFELVYNVGKLQQQMNKFKDIIGGINGVICELVPNDNIEYFKLLWHLITPNHNTLTDYHNGLNENVWNNAFFSSINKNGQIHNYLQNEYTSLYWKTIYKHIQKYCKKHCIVRDNIYKSVVVKGGGFKSMLNSIQSKLSIDDFIIKLYSLITAHKSIHKSQKVKVELNKLFTLYKDSNNQSMIESICDSDKKYVSVLKLILNKDYCTRKSSLGKAFVYCCKQTHLYHALSMLQNICNDRKLILRLLYETVEWNEWTASKQTYTPGSSDALNKICLNKYKTSTEILKYLLNKCTLSHSDKIKLFIKNKEILKNISKYGYVDNVFLILDYFDTVTNNKIQSKKVLMTPVVSIKSILPAYRRYFYGNRAFLIKHLKEYGLFKRILPKTIHYSLGNYIFYTEIIKFILYKSPLYDLDILKLIKNEMINSSRRIRYYVDIIEYLSNDRTKLLSFLSRMEWDVWKVDGTMSHVQHSYLAMQLLDLIFENEIITSNDIYKLFCETNKDGLRKFDMLLNYPYYKSNNTCRVIKALANKKDCKSISLLSKLLMKNGNVINLCTRPMIMKSILDRINDNNKISKLLLSHKVHEFNPAVRRCGDSMQSLVEKYMNYLQFDRNMTLNKFEKEIDISFSKYTTNPFITAIEFGKIETLKKLINNIKINKKEKWMKLLSERIEKYNYVYSDKDNTTSLMRIANCEYNNNNKAINSELLQLLLFNNSALTNEDKLQLLLLKNSKNKTILMRNDTESQCRQLILNYFAKQNNLLSVLNDDIYHDVNSFKYVINSKTLNDKQKLKHIRYVLKIRKHLRYINKSVYLHNILFEILKFIKNDIKEFKSVLSSISAKKALHYAFQHVTNNPKHILGIIDYFKTQQTLWFDALSYDDTLKTAVQYQTDDRIIKEIFKSINRMDYKLQSKLLMIKEVHTHRTFIFCIKSVNHMKIVFKELSNNACIIEKLLNDTSGNGRTADEQFRVLDNFLMAEIIADQLEYIRLNKRK